MCPPRQWFRQIARSTNVDGDRPAVLAGLVVPDPCPDTANQQRRTEHLTLRCHPPADTDDPRVVAPNCTLDCIESRYIHKEVSNSASKARKSSAEAAVAAGTDSQRFW
jgi:hypothetical protein